MREVQHTIEALAKINNERESVIHILRHDLQSPINNSLAVLELIKTDSLDKESIEVLQENFKIQQKRLINSIDFIKSQQNLQSQKESLEQISIKELVKNAIENLHFEIKTKEVNFNLNKVEEDKRLLPRVILDRVLTNILDNAIKHTPKESEIRISSFINDNVLNIKIEDSGEGISENILPKLFKLRHNSGE
ncbi:MAG: HAMP domain-containing histidine kinase [Flavobacteriaceae bacterium]|nr:HAMP domain-containing histidine kinase [Flavobacteriaceae bacterium]